MAPVYKHHYLYKITNTLNGKAYIGVSVCPSDRFRSHCIANSHIGRAIRKYGEHNFTVEKLVCGDGSYIYELEAKAISAFSSKVPNGYNVCDGGYGGKAGTTHTEDARQRISIAQKERERQAHSEATRAKISSANVGRPVSVETRMKISVANSNMSEETREKLAAAKRGKPGKIPSEETRAKMTAAHKARWAKIRNDKHA